MKRKNYSTVIVVLLSVLALAACNKEKEDLYKFDGYIVGFDPCSVIHHYRIGYVIISSDLKDTLLTYSLSDLKYKMPMSVLDNSKDTLYKIPESYINNGWGGYYFQASSRYEFRIIGKYRIAKNDEISFQICSDFFPPNFKRVIVTSASK
jgi:hypothetical protein